MQSQPTSKSGNGNNTTEGIALNGIQKKKTLFVDIEAYNAGNRFKKQQKQKFKAGQEPKHG